MFDINIIRKYPEKVVEGCQKKGFHININKILGLDEEIRKYLKDVEYLRHQRNEISSQISKAEDKELERKLIEKAKEIKNQLLEDEKILSNLKEELRKNLDQIPNLPLDDVPVGKDETENVVLKKVGSLPKFDFKPKDHLEIGENLDLIDVKRGAKVSGTRFFYFKNDAVLLEFALINFAFEFLLKKGFTPMIVPELIKKEMMEGMGYVQEGSQETYFLGKDNLYLIGTAEHSLGPYHSNEILKESELPKRYFAFSSCFRREAGSYGKDTRGVFRVHQFDKIEMFSFCKENQSKKEHLFFLNIEEQLMQKLKIPYQVVRICSGDMAFPTASQYDIEAYFPGQQRYRETHSTSNCTDFQSRRLNIKYRDENNKLHYVHTVNGTVFSQRVILAILENFQRKDNSIEIPKVLQKFMKKKKIK